LKYAGTAIDVYASRLMLPVAHVRPESPIHSLVYKSLLNSNAHFSRPAIPVPEINDMYYFSQFKVEMEAFRLFEEQPEGMVLGSLTYPEIYHAY
jgi:hypothetical protein